MYRRQPLLVAIVLAAALGLVACGDRTLNTDKLQLAIKRGIERQAGITGVAVYCPGNVKIKAHSTFTCTAVDRTGHQAAVRVTQQDSKGRVTYTVKG